MKLSGQQARAMAHDIILKSDEPIGPAALRDAIVKRHPQTADGTARGAVWKMHLDYPGEIVKTADGFKRKTRTAASEAAWLAKHQPPAEPKPYTPEAQAALIASGKLKTPACASPMPEGIEVIAFDAGPGNEGRYFGTKRTTSAGSLTIAAGVPWSEQPKTMGDQSVTDAGQFSLTFLSGDESRFPSATETIAALACNVTGIWLNDQELTHEELKELARQEASDRN